MSDSGLFFYKLILAYNGRNYQGWQSQSNGKAVQDCLNSVFYSTFGRAAAIVGASRTDSGVSALGQVIRLRCSFDLDPERLACVFNRSLPDDITIVSCEKVDKAFHPQACVVEKTYFYRIFKTKPRFDQLSFGWVCPMAERVDWPKFKDALSVFVGTHQFRAFCKIEPGENRQTVRPVNSISFFERDSLVEIKVCAPGFLRYQIRRMLGAAFMVASKSAYTKEHLKTALESGQALASEIDYSLAPEGLCLGSIEYKEAGKKD